MPSKKVYWPTVMLPYVWQFLIDSHYNVTARALRKECGFDIAKFAKSKIGRVKIVDLFREHCDAHPDEAELHPVFEDAKHSEPKKPSKSVNKVAKRKAAEVDGEHSASDSDSKNGSEAQQSKKQKTEAEMDVDEEVKPNAKKSKKDKKADADVAFKSEPEPIPESVVAAEPAKAKKSKKSKAAELEPEPTPVPVAEQEVEKKKKSNKSKTEEVAVKPEPVVEAPVVKTKKSKPAPVVESSSSSDAESSSSSSSSSSEDEAPKTNGRASVSGKDASKEGRKPNTPFQRVNPNEVFNLPEAMQDNSYTVDRAGSYGNSANQILSAVKGKGFRHEKTKKKRGNYRGGELDQEVRSIKFD